MSCRQCDIYHGSREYAFSYGTEYQVECFGVTCHDPDLELARKPVPQYTDTGSNRIFRGDPLPEEVVKQKPNVILAADCVYFEPAFPLLLTTLQELLDLCEDAVIYFCFKKRRRADMQFMKNARKKFVVEEIQDVDRETFSREALFLYTFKRKS
jgi:hypothetical protein